MNIYADSSALVKKYVSEAGSKEVIDWIKQAEIVGTCIVTRAETSAALARATRMNIIDGVAGAQKLVDFRAEWPDLIRLQLNEGVVELADELAWTHGLRGYDAVHLASAVSWQELLGEPVTLMTFDRQLVEGAAEIGLNTLP